MKINFKSPSVKRICLAVLFYLVAAITISLLMKAAPGGPCVPGLGILGFMLLPFISAILFIVNFIKAYKGDKTYNVPVLIHFIFIVGFFILLSSCNSPIQQPGVVSTSKDLQGRPQDSSITAAIIKNVRDTSIKNSTSRTIDILFNGVDKYLGGHRNSKMNFATECMICEPVQVYKQGFLFGKRLYVTKDSVVIYESDRDISDSTGVIKMESYYGERKVKKYQFSNGSLTMKYQGQSCNDADFVSTSLHYDKGTIELSKLLNASFFEYDLDNDGTKEQYLLGTRNCSQELVLLRVYGNSK